MNTFLSKYGIKETIMPIMKVKGGYRWGTHGKTYPTRAQAAKQAAAAHANGYKEPAKKDMKK